MWREQLVDDFANTYTCHASRCQVILDAIQDGVSRLTCPGRLCLRGLLDATADAIVVSKRRRPTVRLTANSVVVKPEVAAVDRKGFCRCSHPTSGAINGAGAAGPARPNLPGGGTRDTVGAASRVPVLRRFHGSAKIDATRLSRTLT